jgi:hypothetical protein
MQTYVLLAVEFLASIACAVFAYVRGGRAERLGAVWFILNTTLSVGGYLAGFNSPLVHLIEDGVYALGLLPLAMIFVSYWIGLVTFVAAALFVLEAVYLLNDWPTDLTYMWFNNCLWLLPPLIFLACGLANRSPKRRLQRESGVQGAAVNS